MHSNEFVLENGLKVEIDSLCNFSFEGLKETLRFLHKKQAVQANQINLLAKQLNIDMKKPKVLKNPTVIRSHGNSAFTSSKNLDFKASEHKSDEPENNNPQVIKKSIPNKSNKEVKKSNIGKKESVNKVNKTNKKQDTTINSKNQLQNPLENKNQEFSSNPDEPNNLLHPSEKQDISKKNEDQTNEEKNENNGIPSKEESKASESKIDQNNVNDINQEDNKSNEDVNNDNDNQEANLQDSDNIESNQNELITDYQNVKDNDNALLNSEQKALLIPEDTIANRIFMIEEKIFSLEGKQKDVIKALEGKDIKLSSRVNTPNIVNESSNTNRSRGQDPQNVSSGFDPKTPRSDPKNPLAPIDISSLSISNNVIPPTSEEVPARIEALENDMRKIVNKINNLAKSFQSQGSGLKISTFAKESKNAEPIIIDWKAQTLKIKNEFKHYFADIGEVHSFNLKNDKVNSKIDEAVKMLNEKINLFQKNHLTEIEYCKADLKKLDSEIYNLGISLSAIEGSDYTLPQKQELATETSPRIDLTPIRNANKDNEQLIPLIAGISPNRFPSGVNSPNDSTKQFKDGFSDPKLKNNFKDLQKNFSDIEKQFGELQIQIIKSNKVFEDKLRELEGLNDRVVTKFEINNLTGKLDEMQSKNNSLWNEIEKVRTECMPRDFSSEIDETKQQFVTLENRITSLTNKFKIIQNKLEESGPDNRAQSVIEIDRAPKKDPRIDIMQEEFNEKFANIREKMTTLESKFLHYQEAITKKVENRAGQDDLQELENKLYREMDKIVSSINRRIMTKADDTKVKELELKIRKLISEINGENKPDMSEEAMLIKRPLGGYSCASCEKEISNIYAIAHNHHPSIVWQKLPPNEPNERLRNSLSYSKIMKSKMDMERISVKTPAKKSVVELRPMFSSIGVINDGVTPELSPDAFRNKKTPNPELISEITKR